MKSWRLEPRSDILQTTEHNTFLGGKPKLPPHVPIPQCWLCGKELTFFFQVAFPEGHSWAGKSMAVFYCTDTWHDQYCIPEIPPFPDRKQIAAGSDFLLQYERNFRILVFDTAAAVPVDGYQEKIIFCPLDFTPSDQTSRAWDFVIGGRPIWIMGKGEKPDSVAGIKKPSLLLQLRESFRFPILPEAPKMADPFFPTKASPFPWYDLFTGNRVYFWGVKDQAREWVYLSVQK